MLAGDQTTRNLNKSRLNTEELVSGEERDEALGQPLEQVKELMGLEMGLWGRPSCSWVMDTAASIQS